MWEEEGANSRQGDKGRAGDHPGKLHGLPAMRLETEKEAAGRWFVICGCRLLFHRAQQDHCPCWSEARLRERGELEGPW